MRFIKVRKQKFTKQVGIIKNSEDEFSMKYGAFFINYTIIKQYKIGQFDGKVYNVSTYLINYSIHVIFRKIRWSSGQRSRSNGTQCVVGNVGSQVPTYCLQEKTHGEDFIACS